MTARKALWIHGGGGTPFYESIDDRSWVGAVLAGSFFDSSTPGIGARGRGHGVLASDALTVSTTGTNNNSVRIGPGMAAIRGSAAGQLGCYVVANDANDDGVLLDNRPTVTNSRRDLIIARVRDNTYGIAGDDWVLDKLTGTAGTSPVDPSVPAGSAILVLARVTISPGANPFTVTGGMITDLRPQARPVGGITPVVTVADYPSPQDFDFAWETSTSILKMRLSGTWVEVARDLDTNWTSVTPNWGGTFTVGNGTHYLRYFKWGRTVTGVAGFERGTTSSQSGSLQLDLDASGLPAVGDPAGGGRFMAGGRAFDSAPSGVFWSASADLDPVDSRIKNFATQGAAAWSATAPFTWATGDHLRIAFNYEAA